MRYLTNRLVLAALVTWPFASAMAETLQCRSINGNVTCAGSGAVSCQTVNGRTTCVSGGGGVVQQFGGTRPSSPAEAMPADAMDQAPMRDADRYAEGDEDRRDAEAFIARRGLSIERRGPAGALSLQRDGTRLRLRTDRLAVDID